MVSSWGTSLGMSLAQLVQFERVVMTVNSILVPTDFSEPSDAALYYATDMARTLGARLFLVHVPGKTGENLEMNFPVAQFETAAHQRLDTLLSPSDIERLRPEYAVRIGVIDPNARAVEISQLSDDGYGEPLIISSGRCASSIIQGFELDLEHLFAGLG